MKRMMAVKRLRDDKPICLHPRLISIFRSPVTEYQCLSCGKVLTEIEAGSLIHQGMSDNNQHMVAMDQVCVSHTG